MRVKQTVLVCADDYAQNTAISEGILSLAAARRVQAISCMVNGPDWPQHASKLLQLRPPLSTASSELSIGLHLNFTHGEACSPEWRAAYGPTFPSLGRLLLKLLLRRLALPVLRAEWQAQWTRFTQAIGREPDFVDGHQHVHQYGLMRHLCCETLQRMQFRGWCRVPSNGLSDLRRGGLRAALVWGLGAGALRRELSQAGIATNTRFAGFYPWRRVSHYPAYFRQFLAQTQPDGVIMCHPGLRGQDETDPLRDTRPQEYAYLMSDQYIKDLNRDSRTAQ